MSWKENPVVGIVAGTVLVIAIALIVSARARQPAMSAELKARIPATPATTPYVK